ncbi:CAP domain-containing protein [Chloroflexota bacterium]
MKNELSATYSELSSTQSELSSTQSELRAIQRELSAIQRELSAIQSELSTTQTELSATYSELSSTQTSAERELTSLKSKLAEADIMQAQFKELSSKYEGLKKQYDAIIEGEGTAEIDEEGIERAVFELINQERINNGLDELIWHGGLYSSARTNNNKMAETGTLQHPEDPSFIQVFWFLGYGTADSIANTALKMWKDNLYSYKQNVLNNAVYGAVSVYKSEEILYITYISYIDWDG